MLGGGFTVTGANSVQGTGVTILNAPNTQGDVLRIADDASVSLTAPISGPFRGVVLMQDPNSTNPIQFEGQSSVTLKGVVYVPDALVRVDGQASVTLNAGPGTAVAQPPILAALIAADLHIHDNGVLTINPDGPSVGNAGFELPNLGVGPLAYRYGNGTGGNPGTLSLADQGGAGWIFSASAGIAANGSAFNVIGADGNQAGLLQFQSTISQVLNGFAAGTTYVVRFLAEGRATQNGANDLRVSIDGTTLTFGGASSLTPGTGSFSTFTSDPFTVAAGTHVLTFAGLDTLGGDRTSFIDDVSVFDPPSDSSSAVVLVIPSGASTDSVASAALGAPVGGGGGSVSGDDSGVQASIVLSRSASVLGSNPSLAAVAPASPSTSAALVDSLSSDTSTGIQVPWSGVSKGVKPKGLTASGVDPWNEQLVDAVFTSL
jgi:hypothetical protein